MLSPNQALATIEVLKAKQSLEQFFRGTVLLKAPVVSGAIEAVKQSPQSNIFNPVGTTGLKIPQ
jgi:hypothetical protein